MIRGLNERARTPMRATIATVVIGALALSGCQRTPPRERRFANQVQQGRAQGVLPWFCHSEGLGGSMADPGDGGLAHEVYAGQHKGDLSWPDCAAVADFFDRTWNSVQQFSTQGAALRAGFTKTAPFVKALGTHDGNFFWSRTGLDPERPTLLQYDGDGPDAPLVGVTFVVFDWFGPRPPVGLPGGNDWLHEHGHLCTGGDGAAPEDESGNTKEFCEAHGGRWTAFPGMWMLHTWIVPGYEVRWDVFSGSNPCVLGLGRAPAPDDPCRDERPADHHGHGS